MSAPTVTPADPLLVTKRWGSFWDTTATQTIPSANATSIVTFNQADPANNGVSMVGGNRMTFAYAGVYSVTFSIQFANTSATLYLAQAWMRKNGLLPAQNLPDSNSRFSITSKHGSNDGHVIGTVNFVLNLAAGDYLALAWSAENTAITLESSPASAGPPDVPLTPCVILTAVQV